MRLRLPAMLAWAFAESFPRAIADAGVEAVARPGGLLYADADGADVAVNAPSAGSALGVRDAFSTSPPR